MKEKRFSAEIEILLFDDDVITTSGGGGVMPTSQPCTMYESILCYRDLCYRDADCSTIGMGCYCDGGYGCGGDFAPAP